MIKTFTRAQVSYSEQIISSDNGTERKKIKKIIFNCFLITIFKKELNLMFLTTLKVFQPA